MPNIKIKDSPPEDEPNIHIHVFNNGAFKLRNNLSGWAKFKPFFFFTVL